MTDADWPAVEAGYAHSFMDCRAPQVWDWRYQRQVPQQAGWVGWITQAPDGAVAAFIGGSVHRGWVHGAEHPFILARDSFSHPRWRAQAGARRGPFTRTEAAFNLACDTEAAICLGFALDRRVRLGTLAGACRPYAQGQWWQAPLTSQIEPVECVCQALGTDFSESVWDALWHQRRGRIRMGLVRDQAFLSWRFDARQGRTYWRLGLWSVTSPTPLGYVVITPTQPGTAMMVDCALPDSPAALRDGLRQISHWLTQRGVMRLDTFCGAACPEAPLLPLLGFVPAPAPQPVLPVYRDYGRVRGLCDVEHDYAFTLADSDLY
jgi:hypothetical protein